MQGPDQRAHIDRAFHPRLQGQRTLARRGQHLVEGHLGHGQAAHIGLQPLESRHGENDAGPVRVLAELAQARVDVAADRSHFQVGTDKAYLRFATGTARGQDGAILQLGSKQHAPKTARGRDPASGRLRHEIGAARYQDVARVRPFRNGGDHESFRAARGQVLEAVDRKIDFSRQQRPLQFRGEKSLAEFDVAGIFGFREAITFGLDDMNFEIAARPRLLQFGHDVAALREGERTAPAAKYKWFHA